MKLIYTVTLACAIALIVSQCMIQRQPNQAELPSDTQSSARQDVADSKEEISKKDSQNSANIAKEFIGYDFEGTKRSCNEPQPGQICTMVYSPEDAFADRCRKLGFVAFTCGCHDHLCSENIAEDTDTR